MKKLKYFIPSILIMVIIFMFSSQTGEESSGLSSQIVYWIQNYLHIPISEFMIRKAAHMSEYAFLTLTYIYGFYKSGFKLKKILLYSILATFTYACSDEIHQLLISGRAGQFTDVLIDTCGGLIMITIFGLFHRKKNQKVEM